VAPQDPDSLRRDSSTVWVDGKPVLRASLAQLLCPMPVVPLPQPLHQPPRAAEPRVDLTPRDNMPIARSGCRNPLFPAKDTLTAEPR